ncbi:reverse transcriptase domain-containing protein [Tanacetum coccineum]
MSYFSEAASGLRPYHFTYPERKLTMEDMLYMFVEERKREHEEMRAFICNFQKKNEILFKERNNSLIELKFGVQELLRVINNTPTIDYEVKGVTTRGAKTTTQDAQNDDTSVHTEKPQEVNHDEPVESNEALTNDQPQITSEPVAQPSNKNQTSSIKRPLTEDDECYGIDDLDNTINAEAQELLINDEPYLFLSRGMEKSIDQSDLDGCKPVECNTGHSTPKTFKSKSASCGEKQIAKATLIHLIYPIYSSWVSPIHVVPKKGGMTVVLNDDNELIPSRTVTGWRVGIVLGHKISGAGFDIEIKDKRGPGNLAADHLSRLENPDLETFTEEEIADEFLDEPLMILKAELNNDEPCEILEILAHCYSGPTGGHYSTSITGREVYESGFYWPSIFKDAKDYVIRCDACQRSENISLRSEMP